ncbi:MAG TPA: hypothetical protein DCL77_01205 [Prolixibacteraceae bacterium]|jgi:parallel beta-helix repeat protein|nr:hypothetical protein [Prolixibacteraceae bacterium]
MKQAIFILVLLLTISNVNATNYYLSSSSGNDLLNDGKSATKAWQSIDQLKTVLNLLLPGDSVLFKCNDIFNGQIYLNRSGNAPKNIYFGSFGSGKKPVITGTAPITTWIQTSTNIWESVPADCGSKVTNFFINNVPQQMGRWPNVTEPNKGYLSFESHKGTNQITDTQLTGAIDWNGAEAVVRRVRWILDRLTIQAHTANTLLFTTKVNYEFLDGFGYFIQNDPKTLDQQGEWYYNPVTKKFSLYSEVNPNTLVTKATQQDNLFKISGRNYITIENLEFNGSGKLTMDIDNCNKITIRNNDFIYSGENAVDLNASNNVLFESNLIDHTNNNAFIQNGCKNFIMRNNVIKNTAMIAGMGLGGDGQYNAVQLGGTNLQVEHNTIDSVGYIGMNFNGDTITIKNNVISNYCMTKDDGGGLYTWGNGTKNYARKLIGNIVMNAIGAPEGSGWSGVAAEGIYIDDRSSNIDIMGNSVYKCGNNGIYIHNANYIKIKGNTVYDNGIQLRMSHDNIAPTFPIINSEVDSNVFVSRDPGQLVASYETVDKDLSAMGGFDYNFYCRPFDDKQVIQTSYVDGTSETVVNTLDNWRSKFGKDQHSGQSPIMVEEYKILGVKSLNYFFNSDFETNISNWTAASKYNNSRITLAKGEGNPGNSLKASFASSSGQASAYMVVRSNNIALTMGKGYRVKFSARSSDPSISIRMIARQNGGLNEDVAKRENFIPGINYSDFEFLIFPTKTEANSRIEFEIPEFHGSVWFDNFEFVEVNVEKTNPDDFIRFEYNASEDDKMISIPANYVDVKGKPVSGNVVLKPFTSIILFKNLATSIGFLPPSIMDSEIRLMPNPASSSVTVKSKEEMLSVSMHDMNGRIIKTYQSRGTTEYTINDLPTSGVYIVNVQTKDRRENRKLFIQN